MISPFSPGATTSSGATRRSADAATTRIVLCRPARPAQPGLAPTSERTVNV